MRILTVLLAIGFITGLHTPVHAGQTQVLPTTLVFRDPAAPSYQPMSVTLNHDGNVADDSATNLKTVLGILGKANRPYRWEIEIADPIFDRTQGYGFDVWMHTEYHQQPVKQLFVCINVPPSEIVAFYSAHSLPPSVVPWKHITGLKVTGTIAGARRLNLFVPGGLFGDHLGIPPENAK